MRPHTALQSRESSECGSHRPPSRQFKIRYATLGAVPMHSLCSARPGSLDDRELADLLADIRRIDMIDVNAIRDCKIIFGQQIPFSSAVEEIAFVLDCGDQLSAHGIDPDRAALRQMVKMHRPRAASRRVGVLLLP